VRLLSSDCILRLARLTQGGHALELCYSLNGLLDKF
jgi:hypothetical protein